MKFRGKLSRTCVVKSGEKQVPLTLQPKKAPKSLQSLSGITDADGVHPEEELSPTSLSESEGSAMDESEDSFSADPAFMSKEMSREPSELTPEPTLPQFSENPGEAGQEEPSNVEKADRYHPLPERPRFVDAHGSVEEPIDMDHHVEATQDQHSRDSSPDSEAYEPPEPEQNPGSPESPGSIYTPPMSLASPGHVEPTDAPRPPSYQSQSDAPLTGMTQDLEADSRNYFQAPLLDV